jgi:hypothetical protein
MSWNVAWSFLFYVLALKTILMARAVCPAPASVVYRAIVSHGARRYCKRLAGMLYLGAATGFSPLVSVRRLVPQIIGILQPRSSITGRNLSGLRPT